MSFREYARDADAELTKPTIHQLAAIQLEGCAPDHPQHSAVLEDRLRTKHWRQNRI
jgi:hypothetical protein